jgi:Zn-finger nucleic acid-binding protein
MSDHSQYRRGALRCPECDEVLVERRLANAHVDLCPECQGIWIDWLDGDIASVAAEVGPLPRSRDEPRDGHNCPLCAAALDRTTLGHEAAVVFRCGSCAGAFVPRGSVDAIVEPPNSDDDNRGEDPALTRLLNAISRFMFGGS